MNARPRVILADPLAKEGVAVLEAGGLLEVEDCSSRGRSELEKSLAGAAALIVRSGTLADEALIAVGERLKVVGRAGVGLDNIDVEAATRRGIAVMNAPAGNTVSTAELAFALLLSAARHIPEADRSLRDGQWDRSSFRGPQLAGKTLGVVGAGRIGAAVIQRARAFGLKVIVSDPYVTEERARDLYVELMDLDAMIPVVDFLTLHVPLTPETEGLMDARRLAMLQPHAVLVNAARGGIVDERALAAALREGRLAAAALDVYDVEPLPADHPLRDAPNLVLTPHLGAATHDAQREVAIEIATAVRAALLDGDYGAAVNMPPYHPADRDRLKPVLDLAERLGSVLGEVMPGGIREVSVSYGGEAQRGLRLISSAVLIGLWKGRLDFSPNLISALPLARERGISVSRSRVGEVTGYRAMLEVSSRAGDESHAVTGGVEEGGALRLLRIDGSRVEVEPRGHLLIFRNRDEPGVVGEVGTLLGAAGVNIAEFHQARDPEAGEALAVLALDEAPGPDLLSELRALPAILVARAVRLEG
ncbi:MAG: phosphoglycerate dehydrogenase [Candidatus Palauibacterales bacterium]|nr:phosphoglycerate dehydrogenase [Candidatus Palauibacterales bacterium]MDP2481697.1 phosphoglycerate dehydrogenase [Candidatus Palauibacterales bacterium]